MGSYSAPRTGKEGGTGVYKKGPHLRSRKTRPPMRLLERNRCAPHLMQGRCSTCLEEEAGRATVTSNKEHQLNGKKAVLNGRVKKGEKSLIGFLTTTPWKTGSQKNLGAKRAIPSRLLVRVRTRNRGRRSQALTTDLGKR